MIFISPFDELPVVRAEPHVGEEVSRYVAISCSSVKRFKLAKLRAFAGKPCASIFTKGLLLPVFGLDLGQRSEAMASHGFHGTPRFAHCGLVQ